MLPSAPDLAALARQIAETLGAPWTTSPAKPWGNRREVSTYENPAHQFLQGEGDERLELCFVRDSNMQRIYLSGRYPATSRGIFVQPSYGTECPVIRVSATRDPAVIAKEIARRLLPTYRKALVAVLERKDQIDAYENAQDANLKLLAEVLSIDPSTAKDHTLLFKGRSRGPWGQIEIFDTTVNMTLRSLPTPLALDVARLLVRSAESDQSPR